MNFSQYALGPENPWGINIWENNDQTIMKDSIIVFGILNDMRMKMTKQLFNRLKEPKPLFEEVETTQNIYIILVHDGTPE